MKNLLTIIVFALSFVIVSARPNAGEEIAGKCISVTDGDTIKIYTGEAVYKVRLEGIDAPEPGQEFSSKAKQALEQKIKGKNITIEVTGYDKYRRMLGKLLLDGEDIQFWLVRNGWAWQFTKYNKSEELKLAQSQAKQEKRGLWTGSLKPMSPWQYRERQRELSKIKKEKQRAQIENKPKPKSTGGYWLNTSSGTRHNRGCRYYFNTKRGRACGPNDGRACGKCGG